MTLTDREGTSFLVVSANKATEEREEKEMVRRLKYIPYGQAWVRQEENGDIVLQSYQTDVILVRNGWFECTGLYSMTTRKHISAFMREYFPQWGFQLAKEWAGSGKRICLATGEIR